jgi:hypothetical protein
VPVSRKSKYRSLVVRDSLAAFLVVQAAIILLGGLVRLCDPDENLVQVFDFNQEAGQDASQGLLNALMHHKTTYYLCGLLVFLMLLGIWGSIKACTSGLPTGGGGGGSGDCCVDCCCRCNCNSSDCNNCSGCNCSGMSRFNAFFVCATFAMQ